MKLYYAPGACSLSPHILLEEASITAELVRVDLHTHKTAAGEDYYTVSPKGSVPVLGFDDGTILTENVAVALYIADRKPECALVPEGNTIGRYRVIEWLSYIASEVHKNFSPLFAPSATDDVRTAATESLHKQFAYLDTKLAGKEYLTGETFTAADAYCFAVIRWTKGLNMDIAAYKNLHAYMERVADRPAVRRAMEAEEVTY